MFPFEKKLFTASRYSLSGTTDPSIVKYILVSYRTHTYILIRILKKNYNV